MTLSPEQTAIVKKAMPMLDPCTQALVNTDKHAAQTLLKVIERVQKGEGPPEERGVLGKSWAALKKWVCFWQDDRAQTMLGTAVSTSLVAGGTYLATNYVFHPTAPLAPGTKLAPGEVAPKLTGDALEDAARTRAGFSAMLGGGLGSLFGIGANYRLAEQEDMLARKLYYQLKGIPDPAVMASAPAQSHPMPAYPAPGFRPTPVPVFQKPQQPGQTP